MPITSQSRSIAKKEKASPPQKSSPFEAARYRHLIPLGLVVLAAIIIALGYSPDHSATPSTDSSCFLYIAQRMLKGEIPYRDLWDHKGPVIYFINVLGLLLGKGSAWGVWILELLFLLGSSILSYFAMISLSNRSVAAVLTIAWLLYYSVTIQGGNLTEEYALLFQFFALYLYVSLSGKGCSMRRLFLFGLLTGLTFFLRPNLIAVDLAIFILLAISVCSTKIWRVIVSSFAAYAAGFGVILLGFILYFGVHSALKDFVDVAFAYNVCYSKLSGSLWNKMNFLAAGYQLLLGLSLPALTSWIALVLDRKNYPMRPSASPTTFQLLILLVPLECWLSSLSGRPYYHYYMSWLPVTVMLTCVGVNMILASSQRPVWLLAIFFSCAVLLPSIMPILVTNLQGMHQAMLGKDTARQLNNDEVTRTEAISYIRDHTKPDDTILSLGMGGEQYFMTGRRAASRYFYVAPLYTVGYCTPQIVERFAEDLRRNRPLLIIDKYPGSPPDIESGLPPRKSIWEKWGSAPNMDAVLADLSTKYRYVTSIGPEQWRVYQRK